MMMFWRYPTELWDLLGAAMAVVLVLATPATAQTRSTPEQEDEVQVQPLRTETPAVQPGDTGRVAGSTVGVAGQRQTRDQANPIARPLIRIAGRIENRVQNRIRNRIDRTYDPQANATSPFAVAGDQARNATPR